MTVTPTLAWEYTNAKKLDHKIQEILSIYMVMKSKKCSLYKHIGHTGNSQTNCILSQKAWLSSPQSAATQQHSSEIRSNWRNCSQGQGLIFTSPFRARCLAQRRQFLYTLACAVNFLDLHICPPTLIHKIVTILRGVIYRFSMSFTSAKFVGW